MKKKFIIIFTVHLLLYSFQLWSQNDTSKIKFDLELRERFDLWDGINCKNYGDPHGVGKLNDKILFQRVIAGFNYKPNKNTIVAGHIQDSRAFGWSLRNTKYPDLFKYRENNTEIPYYIRNPNEEFFEIYDLFFEYRELIDNSIIKAGRQKINFGDNRIFGRGNWGNTGSWTWDAVKLSYLKKDNYISAFMGGTKIHDPKKTSIPFTSTEFWGGGIYAHYKFSNIINLEPFYAYKTAGSANYINTLNFNRHWTGMRIFNPDFYSFEFDFTVVKEFGNEGSKPIDACAYVVKTGYQFKSLFSKPKLSFRKSYASGAQTGNEINTFEPAYGSRNRYYGRINILKWSNIDDYEILLDIFPAKKISIQISCHRFYIPSPVDVTLLKTMKLQEGKHYLGNELDMFAKYKIFKQLEAVSAFSYFWPGDVQPINNEMAKNAKWFTFQLHWKING